MVESRNRMHTREMFKQLYLKYGASHIRLPVGSQFEDSFEALDKIPEDLNADAVGETKEEKGEIIGAHSGIFTIFLFCSNCLVVFIML